MSKFVKEGSEDFFEKKITWNCVLAIETQTILMSGFNVNNKVSVSSPVLADCAKFCLSNCQNDADLCVRNWKTRSK